MGTTEDWGSRSSATASCDADMGSVRFAFIVEEAADGVVHIFDWSSVGDRYAE